MARNRKEKSIDGLRNAVIASAISDILAIRIFNAQRKRNIRIAFFYYYRKFRRNSKYRKLSNEKLRLKIIGMLCKRLKKINLFLETAEKIFGHSEEDKRKLHVVKTMSILEIAKLKRQNVIFTKIELRSDTIIVL